MEVSTEGLLLRGFEQIEARTLDVPFGMVLQPSRYFHVVGPNDNPLMWLIQYEKYTKYSWRSQWWVRAAYLCGNSDEQDWAVRVPSTKFSIETALDWLTPTEVKRALFQGRSVLRQGDFYFVSGDNKIGRAHV